MWGNLMCEPACSHRSCPWCWEGGSCTSVFLNRPEALCILFLSFSESFPRSLHQDVNTKYTSTKQSISVTQILILIPFYLGLSVTHKLSMVWVLVDILTLSCVDRLAKAGWRGHESHIYQSDTVDFPPGFPHSHCLVSESWTWTEISAEMFFADWVGSASSMWLWMFPVVFPLSLYITSCVVLNVRPSRGFVLIFTFVTSPVTV